MQTKIFFGLLLSYVLTLHAQTTFVKSSVITDYANPSKIVVADFNDDATLDIFVVGANWQNPDIGTFNAVYYNDGDGTFTKSAQDFQNSVNSLGIDAADLNGDSYLDVFISNNCGISEVWLNDGTGIFTQKPQTLNTLPSSGVSLGDIDNDGDIDTYLATYHDCDNVNLGTPDEILLNDGQGNFSLSDHQLSNRQNDNVILFDIDNDGDLDAYVTSCGEPDILWKNENETFIVEQEFITNSSVDLDTGDINNDGLTDIFLACYGYGPVSKPNRILLNNGDGTFTLDDREIGNNISQGVSLGDLDNDGDLDAFIVNSFNGGQPNEIWLNNGDGHFIDSEIRLGSDFSNDIKLGDIDSDGDLDAIEVTRNEIIIWENNLNSTDIKIDRNNSLFLYPNPANRLIQLTTNDFLQKVKSYQIIDVSGKLVCQEILDSGFIDISKLSKGVYTIILRMNNERVSRKIVIE